MARFIKLTPRYGVESVWVNSDHIISIIPFEFRDERCSILHIEGLEKGDAGTQVEETLEEILKLMAEAGDM